MHRHTTVEQAWPTVVRSCTVRRPRSSSDGLGRRTTKDVEVPINLNRPRKQGDGPSEIGFYPDTMFALQSIDGHLLQPRCRQAWVSDTEWLGLTGQGDHGGPLQLEGFEVVRGHGHDTGDHGGDRELPDLLHQDLQ